MGDKIRALSAFCFLLSAFCFLFFPFVFNQEWQPKNPALISMVEPDVLINGLGRGEHRPAPSQQLAGGGINKLVFRSRVGEFPDDRLSRSEERRVGKECRSR